VNQSQHNTPGIEPVKTMKFRVSDESGSFVVEADSTRAAAELFVEQGDYGEANETVWVDDRVRDSRHRYCRSRSEQMAVIGASE
jgi:hypothetical protein